MSSRLRLSLGLASLFALALAMPASAVGPAVTAPTTKVRPAAGEDPAPEPAYRFVGYGTDHGVGLSQRGASGRAKLGQDHVQILRHYFTGTRVGTVPTGTTMRALIVKSFTAKSGSNVLLRGGVIKSGSTKIEQSRWTFDTPGVDGRSFRWSDRLVLVGNGKTGAWKLQVQDKDGVPLKDESGGTLQFTDSDAKLTVTPIRTGEGPAVIQVLLRPGANDTYAGKLRIGRTGGKVRIVNHVGIEDFARSVVPQEMGPSNPLEALAAQAVVARSYFLAGRSTSTSFLAYDVKSLRDSHSYKGVKGEKPATSRAVEASAYEVIEWKKSGQWLIARTFYHAQDGGATEASMNVFTTASGKPGTQVKYLMGGPDICEKLVDGEIQEFRCDGSKPWRTDPLTLTQLSKILAKDSRTNVGTLTSWPIEEEQTFRAKRAAAIAADADDDTPAPTYRGVSGRLTWVTLKGTKNGKAVTKKVAGWLFKQVYNANNGSSPNLGSTLFFREPID